METPAGTIAVLLQTEERPTVTAIDEAKTEFLVQFGEGALGIQLDREQLRALSRAAMAAWTFDPDEAERQDAAERDGFLREHGAENG